MHAQPLCYDSDDLARQGPAVRGPSTEKSVQGVESSRSPAQPEEDGAEGGGDDDECGAEFKPIVQLSEVETVSGEEAEAALCDL